MKRTSRRHAAEAVQQETVSISITGGGVRAGEERGVPAIDDDGDGGGVVVRAVRAVPRVPVLLVVQREQLCGHQLLLRHRLRPPRQALRHLRLHAPHLRLRQRQLHPVVVIVIHPSSSFPRRPSPLSDKIKGCCC